jgi:hypothetical protein
MKKAKRLPLPEKKSRPTDPIFFCPSYYFFQHDWPCDPLFSGRLRAARTACQNGVCCHNNYWTKLPTFVRRNYASLVNIDWCRDSTENRPAKKHEKKFKKKIISDLPTLIFSRYETGTTVFLGPMRKTTLYVAEVRLLAPSVNPL